MLLNHYVPKILTALFGGLFVFLGIYTFGEGLLFDRVFYGILVFTAFICRHNVNVIGVILIILVQRLLEEGGWFILTSDVDILARLGFYIFASACIFKFKHDNLSRLLILAFLIAISCEVYWAIANLKPSAIHWFVFALTLNLATRYLIFLRVSYTEDFFPEKAQSINLDWHIYKLNAVSALAQFAMVVEYAVRNALHVKEALYVYKAYPYVMAATGTYAIWIIFNESYRLLIPKLLKA